MKPIKNYDEVRASGDFERLPAGGYICYIVDAEDVPMNDQGKGDYIKIKYDIAFGDFTNHWSKTEEQAGFWGGTFIRSYKEKALGMFKAFTNALEKSNKDYKWDWDEKSLKNKAIGLVLGEEEYRKNDGSVGTRLYVRNVKDIQSIKDGKFTVPEKKTIEPDPLAALQDAVLKDENVPF